MFLHDQKYLQTSSVHIHLRTMVPKQDIKPCCTQANELHVKHTYIHLYSHTHTHTYTHAYTPISTGFQHLDADATDRS